MVAALGEGRLSSDGGALLLAGAERHLQFAARLAEAIADDRDPARVSHGVADILHARILAIASGDEDANDPDALRDDRAFKPAGGRLPDTGQALCSQPTASRLENAPSPRLTVEPTRKPVDPYCATDPTAPARALLDVDDAADAVHGQWQMSFFDAPCDMRCILPIHVCDTATMRPVAVILRSGKTPPDIELRGHARLVASAREVDTHVIVTSLFRLPRRPTRFPIAATTGPIRPIANRSASRSRSRTTAFRWASRASRALRTTASPARIWSPRWRHVTASADACGSPIAPWPARRTLHGCTIRAGVTSSERRMRIVTASKRSSPILPADARSVTASTSSSHPGPEPARRQRCGIPRRAAAGSRRRTRISLAASQSRWHGWPIVSGPRLGPRARHRSIARSDGSRGTTSVPRHASMLVPNHRPRRPACGCRSTPSRPSTTGRPCPRGHMSCGPTSPTGATSGCGTPMSSSPSWKPTSGYRRKG